MMKNRLEILMQERNLKVTTVSHETGISRNTINSIIQNDNEMYRLETINNLCKYLGITPSEFFIYTPIDIEFTIFINNFSYKIYHYETDPYVTDEYLRINSLDIDIFATVHDGFYSKKNYELVGKLNNPINFPFIPLSVYLKGLELDVNFLEGESNNMFFTNVISKIPNDFNPLIFNKLKNALTLKIKETIYSEIDSKNYSEELQSQITNCIEEYVFVRMIYSRTFFPL